MLKFVVLLFIFNYVIVDYCHGGRLRRQQGFIWDNNNNNNFQTTPGANVPPVTQSSARFDQCMRNCQTTPQYDPLCGTDRQTYSNPQRLICAQRCGKNNVQELFRGTCDPQ